VFLMVIQDPRDCEHGGGLKGSCWTGAMCNASAGNVRGREFNSDGS